MSAQNTAQTAKPRPTISSWIASQRTAAEPENTPAGTVSGGVGGVSGVSGVNTEENTNPSTLKASGVGGVPGEITEGLADLAGVDGADAGENATPVDEKEPESTGVKLPDGFTLNRRGLWFTAPKGDSDSEPVPVWICSPLHVVARTRNADSEAWGFLLEWKDRDGRKHQWPCPASMLASDGAEFRRVLLDGGLEIAPHTKARSLLATYVQSFKTKARAVSVERSGWHEGVYVTAECTFGAADRCVVLQTEAVPPRLRKRGTLENWKRAVADLCVGNSRLVLALSASFAAPLLDITGDEGGGIHFVGASSTGKTTAARVAVSAWGDHSYMQSWRTTANGLEATALSLNDGLLVLDELGQVAAHEAGDTAYQLANGSGKRRARQDGAAKRVASWRVLFLSTGEIGLAAHMREAGKRARAGQETRFAELPADAGAGHGIFENLHGRGSGGRSCR